MSSYLPETGIFPSWGFTYSTCSGKLASSTHGDPGKKRTQMQRRWSNGDFIISGEKTKTKQYKKITKNGKQVAGLIQIRQSSADPERLWTLPKTQRSPETGCQTEGSARQWAFVSPLCTSWGTGTTRTEKRERQVISTVTVQTHKTIYWKRRTEQQRLYREGGMSGRLGRNFPLTPKDQHWLPRSRAAKIDKTVQTTRGAEKGPLNHETWWFSCRWCNWTTVRTQIWTCGGKWRVLNRTLVQTN